MELFLVWGARFLPFGPCVYSFFDPVIGTRILKIYFGLLTSCRSFGCRPIGVLRPIKLFIANLQRPMGGRHRIGNSTPILYFLACDRRAFHPWLTFVDPPWRLFSVFTCLPVAASVFPLCLCLDLGEHGLWGLTALSLHVWRDLATCIFAHRFLLDFFWLSLSYIFWALFILSVLGRGMGRT